MPEPLTPLSERPWEDIERMLDVDAALGRILSAFAPLDPVSVPLLEAASRTLASDVVAHGNVPPFRNSAMDGYAVRARETSAASWAIPVRLPVAAHVAAGQKTVPDLPVGTAIRIMTGAPLPAGADAVVRFEETDEARSGGLVDRTKVQIFRPAAPLDNVREAGEDIVRGTIVARKGKRLSPADVGLLASVGHASVSVHRQPVVSILSTGNEVVEPDRDLPGGAIRDSNSYVLGAMARQCGADVRLHGIAQDSVAAINDRLDAARHADLIVTSGGVSLGDFDVVKDVLRGEGDIAIWQVRMKPGKPLAFGHIGGTPLLGLPGNPVAAAVSFLVFGRPAIKRMMGESPCASDVLDVVTAEPIDNRGQRRHYVRVRLEPRADGALVARSVGEQGAGVLSSLAAANALLVVPETMEFVAAGTRLQAMTLDW